MKRIRVTVAVLMALAAVACVRSTQDVERYNDILLTGFKTVSEGEVINFNIGTSAHCPATLSVLEKYLSEDVTFTAWANAPLGAGASAVAFRVVAL
ncbi:MAG: hypothetical protein MJY56_00930 [Bacteroidales bacterium]|nr:hypothetical protein [Bacteroidales bacterium]